MKIRINKGFASHKKGDIITVDTDSNGTPVDRYWRRRLKDAEIDNCCEAVMTEKPASVTTSSEKPVSDKKRNKGSE